jgi:hypothetical protein
MREIALLLVLANLGFLAWGTWVAPEPARVVAAPAAVEKVPRLVLASEAPTRPADAADVEAGEAGATAGGATGSDGSPSGSSVEIPDEAIGALPPSDAAPALNDTGSPDGTGDTPGTAEIAPPAVTKGVITQDVRADGRPANAAVAPPPANVTRVALAAATPAPHCMSLGPFLDLAETAEAAARLRERGHLPSQRLADSPLWVGYWVSLAPFPTRDEAVAAVEKLRARGVADLYVEPNGEDANAVSLGLYSDRERAEAVASTIRGLGYVPQISDRYRTASVYWVDVVLPPRVQLNPASYAVRSGRPVRAEEHECPEGTQMPGVVAEARDEY